MSEKEEKTKSLTVFLSYARGDDEAFVRSLHDDLEVAGFDAWFDRIDMPQRPLTFHQEISDAIRERDRLIYIAGPCAASSDYVRQEWRLALAVDKHVMPLLRIGEYQETLPGQLAFMHCEDFRDDTVYNTQFEKLIKNLRQPEPPLGTLKAVPNLPQTFLARPQIMRRIKDALLIDLQKPVVVAGAAATVEDQGDAVQQVGVHGMGGIGKSVVAAGVIRDHEVRRAYPDGIAWMSFGQDPNVAALMRECARHLGCDASFETVTEGEGVLKEFFAQKSALLVLDDVWRAQDAEAFDVFGPRCRVLITTRDAGILHTLQGELFSVELLSETEARQLLAETTVTELNNIPPEADEIVRECGCLPLALALAGSMVAKRSDYSGAKKSQRAWRSILERLRRADLDKIRDRHAINPRHKSIWRAMAASVEMLNDEQKDRFLELSAFRSDQRTPESAVATLWEYTGKLDELDTEDLLVELNERSLVRLDTDENGTRRVSLHDLLYDFASGLIDDPLALQNQLLEAYSGKCSEGWHKGPNDGYFYSHLAYHLSLAQREKDLKKLLFNIDWMITRIKTSSLSSLLLDYTFLLHDQEVKMCRDGIRLSAHVIAEDLSQLKGQLCARLDWADTYFSQEILKSERSNSPWFRPVWQSLNRPGGPLIQTWQDNAIRVWRIALSDNKKRVFSTTQFVTTLKVWDVSTGAVLRTMGRVFGGCNALAISADGELGFSGHENGALLVWNLEDGTVLHQLDGHTAAIWALSVSADGKRAITGSDDNTLRVWDIVSGVCRYLLEGHTDKVSDVAMCRDGECAISASYDGTLKHWDTIHGTLVQTLAGHPGFSSDRPMVYAVDINADGKIAVSAGGDYTFRLWDLVTGEQTLLKKSYGFDVRHISISANGKVVFCSPHSTAYVWDTKTGDDLFKFDCGESVGDVALSTCGKRGLTALVDGTIRLWDLTAKTSGTFFPKHKERVNAITVCRGGQNMMSASGDGVVRLYDLKSLKKIKQVNDDIHGHLNDMKASSDGRVVITCGFAWGDDDYEGYGYIHVWDIEKESLVHRWRIPKNQVLSASITKDGSFAFTAFGGRKVDVWDLHHGKRLLRLSHNGAHSLAISADNKCLATCSSRMIKVWDWKGKKEIYMRKLSTPYSEEDEGFGQVMLNSMGSRLINSIGNRIEVWDLKQDKLSDLYGHEGGVLGLALSLDGELAASTGWDRTVRLWNLVVMEEVACFTADQKLYTCQIFPDEISIVAGDYDGALHMFKLEGIDKSTSVRP